MTIRLTAEQTYAADKAKVGSCVLQVLDGNRVYKRVYSRPDRDIFSAIVRPNIPLVLGTDLTIKLVEEVDVTRVIADLESQPYIIGDAFGFYERYIQDFFSALRRIAQAEGIAIHNEIMVKTSRNWLPIGLLVTVLLLLLAVQVVIIGTPGPMSFMVLIFMCIGVLALARLIRTAIKSQ